MENIGGKFIHSLSMLSYPLYVGIAFVVGIGLALVWNVVFSPQSSEN
jgi:hypothetical protein